jgi:hypothetical protein
MNDPLLEELYEIRAKIWKECGETIDGYFAYMSRPIPGVRYADPKPSKPRRPRPRPFAAKRRKKAVACP